MITDMNEPLAPALGNAVEVAICMEVLAGNAEVAPRLYDLTVGAVRPASDDAGRRHRRRRNPREISHQFRCSDGTVLPR